MKSAPLAARQDAAGAARVQMMVLRDRVEDAVEGAREPRAAIVSNSADAACAHRCPIATLRSVFPASSRSGCCYKASSTQRVTLESSARTRAASRHCRARSIEQGPRDALTGCE